MAKVNITLIDAEVEPISVLTFKKIRIGANHNASTNTTTISSIYDGTTEQEINDNYATWKQEFINYQPTQQVLQTRRLAYPQMSDQLDMIYHDQVDGTTTFKEAIQAVKDAIPKP